MKRKDKSKVWLWGIILVILIFLGGLSFIFFKIQNTFLTSSVNLQPIADSYVDSKSPNSNEGTRLNLYAGDDVRSTSSGGTHNYQRNSFIKFKVSDNIRSKIVNGDYRINSAVFGIYIDDTSSAVNDFYTANNNWGESTLTYNNQPTLKQKLLTIELQSRYKNRYYEIPNIEIFIQTQLLESSEITIAITNAPENVGKDHQTKFDSKEDLNPAYLKFIYEQSQTIYRLENNLCNEYKVFDKLQTDYSKISDCKKLLNLTVYRFLNISNDCNMLTISTLNITSDDYTTLIDCKEQIIIPITITESSITNISFNDITININNSKDENKDDKLDVVKDVININNSKDENKDDKLDVNDDSGKLLIVTIIVVGIVILILLIVAIWIYVKLMKSLRKRR